MAVAQWRLQGDSTLEERTCLKVKEVMELLEFCLSATFLGFQGSVYRQTFGTAMGSGGLGDDRKLGDGGHGRGSSCNSKRATLVLEAICR